MGEFGYGAEVYEECEVRGEFEIVSWNSRLNYSLDCATSVTKQALVQS
jgi:hypothetical protein